MYLHSADRWWSSSVALYDQQTNQSQQAIEQTKFIQKVVSPDVSKPNHAVMNKKQDKKQFSLEKKMDSSLLPTHHTGWWIVI